GARIEIGEGKERKGKERKKRITPQLDQELGNPELKQFAKDLEFGNGRPKVHGKNHRFVQTSAQQNRELPSYSPL
ncbi:hypothetical protein KEJ36_04335, partial [Candidatus Bathyarchaeota archaeon]|nr:hypothetical protein [Candidatus Bathyarchaeota archaeon]